jgi:hypothetical protein
MQIAWNIQRRLIRPVPPIVIHEANTEHKEGESPLWKVTSKATASQLFSAEDGLLILFGFISGFAIASSFGQILGLFA